MMVEPKELWTAGGVLLGFQLAAFSFRVNMENRARRLGLRTWIIPSDFLNIASMTATVLGLFLLPVLGFYGVRPMLVFLGLAVLLFAGHTLGVPAHYQLYRAKEVTVIYFPTQERIVLYATLVLALLYVVLAVVRSDAIGGLL